MSSASSPPVMMNGRRHLNQRRSYAMIPVDGDAVALLIVNLLVINRVVQLYDVPLDSIA